MYLDSDNVYTVDMYLHVGPSYTVGACVLTYQ